LNLARKVALNAAALVAGRVLVVIGGIGTVALASRYLSLEEYGALIVAAAFVGILEVLTDLGVYTMAAREIALAPADERRIVGNVLGLAVTVTAVVAATGWLALQIIYSGPEHELLREAATYLILGMVGAPIGGVTRAHFVANQRAYLSAIGEVANVATTAAMLVLAVTQDWGFTGVAIAQPVGRVAQAVVATALMRPDIRFSLAAQPAYWRKLLVISLPLGAALIVNFLYFRIDAVLIAALRSTEEAALYGLAYKVLESMIFLPSYFMITLFPEIARLDAASERLRQIVGQALAIMEMIALPVLVLTAVFAEEAVTLIGGAKFEDAALALQILALALAILCLNGVYTHALVALGRQASLLRVTVVVLTANVAMNLVAIPLFGIEGAAAAVAASELLNLIALRRIYRAVALPPRNDLRARMLLASLALLVALGVRLSVPLEGVALAAVGTVAALCCYVAALFALKAIPEAIQTQLLEPLRRRASLR
jgi:O-antigen/teichoic acid export membrane protein